MVMADLDTELAAFEKMLETLEAHKRDALSSTKLLGRLSAGLTGEFTTL